MAFSQTEAQKRLIAVGLTPTQSTQIAREVQKWITCNGEQYTVDRIKDMKVSLARHFAGLSASPSPSLGDKGRSWVRVPVAFQRGLSGSCFGCLSRTSGWLGTR